MLAHKMDIYHLQSRWITWRHRSTAQCLLVNFGQCSHHSHFQEILRWIRFIFSLFVVAPFARPPLETYNFWAAPPIPFTTRNTVIHWDNKRKKCADCARKRSSFPDEKNFYFILNEILMYDGFFYTQFLGNTENKSQQYLNNYCQMKYYSQWTDEIKCSHFYFFPNFNSKSMKIIIKIAFRQENIVFFHISKIQLFSCP